MIDRCCATCKHYYHDPVDAGHILGEGGCLKDEHAGVYGLLADDVPPTVANTGYCPAWTTPSTVPPGQLGMEL